MKSYVITRPSDHEGWLAQRSQGIGSSEVAAVMGCSPYLTKYQLWRRKKGLDGPVPENFAMKAGHYLEDAVSRFFADETGLEIIKASAGDWLAINREKPHLRVSPDRLFWLNGMKHNADNRGICECKTTQLDVNADDVRSDWFCQLQYQLGVMELPLGALAWLKMGREFGYAMIDADAEFYRYMVAQLDEFWTRYIIGDEEPEAANVDDVMLKYPRHTEGKSVTATDEVLAKVAQLKELKEKEKLIGEAKTEVEDAIKTLLLDAELLVDTGGNTLATWKSAKDTQKFDAKAFQKANPEEAAKYMVTAQGSRRLIIK